MNEVSRLERRHGQRLIGVAFLAAILVSLLFNNGRAILWPTGEMPEAAYASLIRAPWITVGPLGGTRFAPFTPVSRSRPMADVPGGSRLTPGIPAPMAGAGPDAGPPPAGPQNAPGADGGVRGGSPVELAMVDRFSPSPVDPGFRPEDNPAGGGQEESLIPPPPPPPIPEPAQWLMIALGLGGIGVALRRRRMTAPSLLP